jgi:hypothetical protein
MRASRLCILPPLPHLRWNRAAVRYQLEHIRPRCVAHSYLVFIHDPTLKLFIPTLVAATILDNLVYRKVL